MVTHIGSGTDPSWLRQAAEIAKHEDAVLLAESTSRFIRSQQYHSAKRPDAQPSDADLQHLRECTGGVRLVTVLPPDATPQQERAFATKRGQVAKARKGGRPRKSKPGYKKLRRERELSRVHQLRHCGATITEIHIRTGIPRMTIFDWLRRYPCGCTVFSEP